MREDDCTFEDLAAILPEFWREKAKELGALQAGTGNEDTRELAPGFFIYPAVVSGSPWS
jgi:hypothetical protein